MKPIVILATFCAVAVGQGAGTNHAECTEKLNALTRAVLRLEIEVATHRLQWHEANLGTLRSRLARTSQDRAIAEQQERSADEEVLGAEMLLSRSDLSDGER